MRTLLALIFLLPTSAFGGEVVFHCLDSSGGSVYQDRPCPGRQETIKIRRVRNGEAFAEAIARGLGNSAPRPAAPASQPPSVPAPVATLPQPSFKCQAADGTTFYRHDGCPPALQREQNVYFTVGQDIRYYTQPVYVPVGSTPVSRSSACRTIYGSDASQRTGSNLDQRFSTYDRNLGRDPCR